MEDASTCDLLIKKNVIGRLITAMSDLTMEVQLQAAGALRNLTTVGGEVALNEMISQDLVSVIVSLMHKVSLSTPFARVSCPLFSRKLD
jgi:hypothetical protein